jgi:hypothetical protein
MPDVAVVCVSHCRHEADSPPIGYGLQRTAALRTVLAELPPGGMPAAGTAQIPPGEHAGMPGIPAWIAVSQLPSGSADDQQRGAQQAGRHDPARSHAGTALQMPSALHCTNVDAIGCGHLAPSTPVTPY